MSLLGSAIPGEVGLRLLLSPVCSNIVIRTACCTVGTVFPVYYTFKSIERNDHEAQYKWLVYWAAYGSFTLVEVFSDKLISWFPYYYHMKFAFLVWLQFPSHNGASHLYQRHIRPFLLKHQGSFDKILSCSYRETSKFLGSYQSEILLLKSVIMKGATTANQMLIHVGLFHSHEHEERPNGSTSSTDANSDADTLS